MAARCEAVHKLCKAPRQLLASLSGREKGTKADYLKFTIAAFFCFIKTSFDNLRERPRPRNPTTSRNDSALAAIIVGCNGGRDARHRDVARKKTRRTTTANKRPRCMTILSASGNGLCSAFASSHDARIQHLYGCVRFSVLRT